MSVLVVKLTDLLDKCKLEILQECIKEKSISQSKSIQSWLTCPPIVTD